MITRIKALVEQLNKASDAYYNTGHEIMTDSEFDASLTELRNLEQSTGFVMANSPTQNVGSEIKTQLTKVRHTRPMLSLDKCHSAQELIDFAEDDDCYMSIKCDGLTTRLIYEDGNLVGAETRGDGEIGQDVLFHVKEYVNVPVHIPTSNRFVVDGESVIFHSDFEIINNALPENEHFANPRNLASGTLSNLDASITKQRCMRFIAWRVIEGDDTDSHFWRLKNAEKLGFTIVPMWTYVNSADKDNIEEMLHALRKQANQIGLPMDGIVISKNSDLKSESMGRTSKFFRHSIAYKFEDETYETKLEYIDWTLGRSGVLTPTAVFKPVIIDGSEVSRASVHNLTVMKKLELTNHCTVNVFKANCIIPQIYSCENDGDGDIKIPSVCPVCGVGTTINKDNESEVLVCTNPNCAGKMIAKFTHFVSKKCMNIDGLSTEKLSTLISLGYINDFKSIYSLSKFYDQLIKVEGLGPKSVEKLLLAIEKSRNVRLENFIAALGIPNIGLSAAKTISTYCNGSYDKFFTLCENDFDWTNLDDFGEVMAQNLNDYMSKWWYEVNGLAAEMNFVLPEKQSVNDSKFTGKSLCVTGKLNHFTRDSINEKITSLGAKAVGSVSKKVDYLITNEASGSSKYKKAVELGVPIITEEEFLNMCGE